MATRSAKREQFLEHILATVAYDAISYWVEEMKCDWDTNTINIVDIEGDSHTITADTIVKGINMIVKRNAERDKALILANRTNGDDGDFDALDADKIVQFSLFNELVYG